jgi:exopolysaccharide biosynthesis polyprenyl glycosylphosphotransferase
MRPGEKDRHDVVRDRGAAKDAAERERTSSRLGEALTTLGARAAQPIEMRRMRRQLRAAWAAEHSGISVSSAVMTPTDSQLLDGSRSGAAIPLLAPRLSPRRQRAHYLLEGPGWTSLRLAADLLMALVAVIVTVLTVGDTMAAAPASLIAFPLAVTAMLSARGMYQRRVRMMVIDVAVPVIGAVSVAAMTVLAWEVFVHGDAAAGPYVGRVWAIALVLVAGGRAFLTLVQSRARAAGLVGKPTLIVGAGNVGAQVARRLEEHREYGLRPVGFLDADPPDREQVADRRAPILGSPEELAEVAFKTDAEHVIFAFSSAPDHDLIPLTRRAEELGLEVSLVPRFFESINDRMAVERLGGLPLLGLRAVDPKGWQFRFKYAFDRPLAALMLLVAAPIMLLTALAVKLTSPGPVFFSQRRVGRDGQVFDLYKFRSMRVEPEADGFRPETGRAPGGVEGRDRRTPIGRFLRRSAIDELPQLFNVLKGEMSLVGPRPERPEFVELFGRDHPRYSDRHRVKSGITGWAQVQGLRGQTSLADRIEWDNSYIECWSLWFDIKIMLLTVGAVLRSGDDA